MCTIPKNGSSRWRALLLKMIGDRDPQVMHAAKYPNLNSSRYGQCFFDLHESFMLVRNPYVRFFSYYYDKYVRSSIASEIPSISEVIRGLNRATCEEHHCPQTSMCFFRQLQYKHILKVEELSMWYPAFVKRYKLQSVVEDGWDTLSEHHSSVEKCFYHPRGMTCDTYKSLEYPVTRQHDVCNFTNPKLFRCSLSNIEDLVKEDTDALTEFYFEDLIAFGYPSWNGRKNDFKAVSERNSSVRIIKKRRKRTSTRYGRGR